MYHSYFRGLGDSETLHITCPSTRKCPSWNEPPIYIYIHISYAYIYTCVGYWKYGPYLGDSKTPFKAQSCDYTFACNFFSCAYMYICIVYICMFLQGTVVRLSHWLYVFLSKTLQFSHWLHVFLSKTHDWIGWRETHCFDGEKHIQSMCTHATQLPTPNMYRTRVLCEKPQNPQCIFRISVFTCYETSHTLHV